jgi:hypothetical protein
MSGNEAGKSLPYRFERSADLDTMLVNPTCMQFAGRHNCPAAMMDITSIDSIILLTLLAPRANVYVGFTPAGARQFAADLVQIADQVEAAHVDEANAKLAATLNKRGQA